MLPAWRERITGYFIEETKDSLTVIERGLLNLPATLSDPESVKELCRAANSLKGGAAMLGISSIQKIAHHLEQCFKAFKDNPVKPDRKLEVLLLHLFITLQELLDHFSGPFGLKEEVASQIIWRTWPVIDELNSHLQQLLNQGWLNTCKTCRYFYGLRDGGNFLICAVHPAGPQEDFCRDWEGHPTGAEIEIS
ncbi:Hpt domain-containing protein [Kamptonema formosum]|uniref:Hpt domain-containing protein n=1 Tax=Kamptonema formosum TaxID=331992 RepID=UPI00034BEE02|nr:Hpt domain-containing protein [Oscillatoria sp. PCC 10802]